MTIDLEPQDLWNDLVRAGAVPPTPEGALERARAVARAAAEHELRTARIRKVRRRRIRYGVVAAAAAGVIALGALKIDLGGQHLGAESAAAATLHRAATATLAQEDPVVRPGQYLKVTRVVRRWNQYTEDSGPVVGRDGKPAISEELETSTIWMPYDIDQPWTHRSGWHTVRNISSDPRYRGSEVPTTTTRGPSWAKPGTDRYINKWDPRWYASLPRDPEGLIAALDAEFTGEGSGADYRFTEGYSEILRSPLAPADIRAALFEGLARLPEMEVRGDVTTLDGRSGIAIGARGAPFSMVFDKETGLLIGESASDRNFPDVPGLDAGKTTYLTSVTTSVVDHAPKAPWAHILPG